jgi:hypothetical protein
VDEGAQSSELCSDWKTTAGALNFLYNPKHGMTAALLRVRYCLVGWATVVMASTLEWCIGGVEPESSVAVALDLLRPRDWGLNAPTVAASVDIGSTWGTT